jgi:hypothetical protein
MRTIHTATVCSARKNGKQFEHLLCLFFSKGDVLVSNVLFGRMYF